MSFDFTSENPFSNTASESPFAGFQPPIPPDGCTQCAMCLSSCPTYQKSADPQQSPMGRIRLMRVQQNDNDEALPPEQLAKLESCLGCYSCESVCPSRVSFGNLMDNALVKVRQQQPLPAITRMMLTLAQKGVLLKSLTRLAYLSQQSGLRALLGRLGLYRLMGLARANELLGAITKPVRLRNRTSREHPAKRVALFTGCFGSVLEQDVQQAAIDVLNALGLEVVTPSGQGCCGALHRHSGEAEAAVAMARNNIKVFAGAEAHAIVTTSSGCGAGLKAYDEWLGGDGLTTPVLDVSHYLVEALKEHMMEFAHTPLKVALHTPCTLRQGEDQEHVIMELLQKVPGLEILPLPANLRCCGAGGSQMLSHPEMADALRDDVVTAIRKMEVDVVVSSNLGCALHLRHGLAQAASPIPLLHPVQLVAQAMKGQESPDLCDSPDRLTGMKELAR